MSESIKHIACHSMLSMVVALGLTCTLAPVARAIQASPLAFEETQPDGSVVKLRVRGDEHFNWMEDEKGYTVVRTRAGEFNYGRRNGQGRVVSSGVRVGRGDPRRSGLVRGIMPSEGIRRQMGLVEPQLEDGSGSGSAPGFELATPVLGVKRNLVVLMEFSDHTGRTLPSQSDMNVLFNANSPDPTLAPTGSVKAYYREVSYTQFTLESTVTVWVTLPQTEAYYANGVSGLGGSKVSEALRYALNAIDGSVNFNDFDSDSDGKIDAIAFIHSGYGAEWGATDQYGTPSSNRIWSHKSSLGFPGWVSAEGVAVSNYHISPGVWHYQGSAIGRIGVICHETGHFFGLPDLYDTDPSPDNGNGIGSWGLMANSWGFDNSQHYPPHFSSWSRIQLGWMAPPIVLDGPGNYALGPIGYTPSVIRIDENFPPGEYLLIENRQPFGFEADMPQGGLLVLHIDENAPYNTQGYPGQAGWPTNGKHYRVAVLQADGAYHLEKGTNRGDGGDVFRENGASIFGPSTVPSTDTYQGGVVLPTGHTLFNIKKTGENMAFTYSTEVVNALADISVSDTSLSYFTPTAVSLDKTLTVSNTADTGGQDLDYTIDISLEGEGGSEYVGDPGPVPTAPTSLFSYGNVYEVDRSTQLRAISAAVRFTGTNQFGFVVYEMDGVGEGFEKVAIYAYVVDFVGQGAGFYGVNGIEVPLQAGKFYIISALWGVTPTEVYFENSGGSPPETSFGRVNRGHSMAFPLPDSFSTALGADPNTYHQLLTIGPLAWLSVDASTGTIGPQGMQTITVTANANGFAPGTYQGGLTISSNDLDENPLTLPVGLLVGLQNQVYVNFGYPGVELGSSLNPYNTLAEGLAAVQTDGTVTIAGGGFSPETLDIAQGVNIEVSGSTATIGQSGVLSVVEQTDGVDVPVATANPGRPFFKRYELPVEEVAPARGRGRRPIRDNSALQLPTVSTDGARPRRR